MFFKKGIKVSCPNCGGHTRVVGKYGECDYCGSLLTSPIPQTTNNEPIQLTKQESMARFQATETIQEMENILREAGHPMCVSDICRQMSEPITAQKCAAYVRRLVDSGKVERIEDKRKVYFVAKGA
jgi:hypothetical protein